MVRLTNIEFKMQRMILHNTTSPRFDAFLAHAIRWEVGVGGLASPEESLVIGLWHTFGINLAEPRFCKS